MVAHFKYGDEVMALDTRRQSYDYPESSCDPNGGGSFESGPSRRVSNQVFDPPLEHSPAASSRKSSIMPDFQSSFAASRRGSQIQPQTSYAMEDGFVPDFHTGRRLSQQDLIQTTENGTIHGRSAQARGQSVDSLHSKIVVMNGSHPSSPSRECGRQIGSKFGDAPAKLLKHSISDDFCKTCGGSVAEDDQAASAMTKSNGNSSFRSLQPMSVFTVPSQANQKGSVKSSSKTEVLEAEACLMCDHCASPGPNKVVEEVVSQDYRELVSRHYEQTYDQTHQQIDSAHQLLNARKEYANSSPDRPYPRRPKNRNSNLLSAVLCLIKELDGPSLEVAEMAIRCRMEELED